jgi:serine/threonine-protein kinase
MTEESGATAVPDPDEVAELYDAALELPPGERGAFLDGECAGRPALRAEVDSLLAAHEQAPSFLGSRPAAALLGAATLGAMSQGERVGPYRLVSELGRGGMGAVYLAERADGAFEQRVALKVIGGGFVSAALRERFLRERQILARLEHPNIARLLDGGIAEDGSPYFAMELVRGTPLVASCDARRLPVAARLELFDQACRAVQHAHANLIVHRDLKPSNMLVAEDGSVKLLDFGIAKALSDDADEGAALTRGGAQPLTPEYAAPEQLRGEAATTATDVYALGVVLYELLTGRRPFPAASMADRSGVAREPRPMAAAVSRPPTAGGESSAVRDLEPEEIAAARGTTPERLRRALTGDLEAIVQQALQPEAKRRYASVEALAEELRRSQSGQPVRARPATLRYRTGKLLRRHRVAVAASAMVAVSLVGGLGAALWQASEARHQAELATAARRQALAEAARVRRETERAEKIAAFLKNMILEANPTARSTAEPPTLQQVVRQGAAKVEEQLAGEPGLQAQMMIFFGDLALGLEDHEGAAPLVERAHAIATRTPGVDAVTIADAEGSLGQLRFFQRRPQEADAAFRSALVRLEHRLAANPGDERALGVSATISNLRAQTLWYLDRVPEAIAHAEQALAMNARLYGAESRQVAIVLTNLAGFQHNAGRLGDAERSYRRSLALHEKLFGPSDARLRFVASGLADVLFKLGRLDDSYRLYEQALAAGRKGLGPTHTGVGVDLLNLGRVRLAQGRFAEAEARLAESEALAETTSTRSYVAVVHAARGEILAMQGRPAEAAARYRQARRVLAENQRAGSRQDVMLAVELARLRGEPAAAASELAALVETVRSQAPSSAEMVTALQALGETLVDAGRVEEGIAKLREAVALGEGDVGPDRLQTARADLALGLVLARHGGPVDEWRARLRAAVRRLEAHGRGWWREVAQARRLLAEPS